MERAKVIQKGFECAGPYGERGRERGAIAIGNKIGRERGAIAIGNKRGSEGRDAMRGNRQ